jgi:hypothetical protein
MNSEGSASWRGISKASRVSGRHSPRSVRSPSRKPDLINLQLIDDVLKAQLRRTPDRDGTESVSDTV